MIGIDTAKDDKFACSFHHFCSGKARHRDPVAHALLFIVPRTVASPNRILLLNDQLQLNRVVSFHFFALQYLISSLNAFRADLLRQLCDGRRQFATVYCFSPSGVPSNPTTITSDLPAVCSARRAPSAISSFCANTAGRQDVRSAGSASRSGLWCGRNRPAGWPTLNLCAATACLKPSPRSRAAEVPAMPCSSMTFALSPTFSRCNRQPFSHPARCQRRYGSQHRLCRLTVESDDRDFRPVRHLHGVANGIRVGGVDQQQLGAAHR